MTAREKLEEAIRDYVREAGEGQLVPLDWAITMIATSWDAPGHVTMYFTENRGPIHSMLGLTEFQRQHFLALNREEAEADQN